MFSIRRFFGHDEKFFDLLEASAQQADSSVHHLVALLAKLEHHEPPQSLEEFVASRREDKRITQELTEQLCKTFITPLEREDIQALAAALYKIPTTVEKIGERILIFPADLHGRSFKKHLDLLDQAAETVLAMVKELRKGTNIARAREMNAGLQTIKAMRTSWSWNCSTIFTTAITTRSRSFSYAISTSSWKKSSTAAATPATSFCRWS